MVKRFLDFEMQNNEQMVVAKNILFQLKEHTEREQT